MLEQLRKRVCQLHLELRKYGLVAWTSGNVSGLDRETRMVVIKPSGVMYEDLTPESMVVVDLEGRRMAGDMAPSVDCPTHLHIYRARPDVGGIAHTHSPHATAFAAVGESIPCVLTAIADEFGGPIPCGGYAQIGEDQIGEEVVRSIGSSPAILLKSHGVFAIGPDPTSAVKTAVMTEDAARTVFLARQLGSPQELPIAEVARAHGRYLEKYGQR